MSQRTFLEAVQQGPLVFDGAVGTQLYERGVYVHKSFDDANLSRSELVRAVHAEYLEAGADVLTTNTFASNRIKLARHGLAEKVQEINAQGVRLALEAAQGRAFVAGSMGPTGWNPSTLTDAELAQMRLAFEEQALALAEAGADLIVLETFRQLPEIRMAMEAVRKVCPLPVVAQMSFDAERRTGDGADPARVAILLRDWGADVLGANCMEGPHVLYDVVVEMLQAGPPVIAQPNAGYPQKVDERLLYMATPEYFGVYARRFLKAGVRIVGGCCGTGPEHIRQVAAAARMMGGGRVQVEVGAVLERPDAPLAPADAVPVQERSRLAAKILRAWEQRVRARKTAGQVPAPLAREHFAVSVEVNPPPGLRPDKALEAARMLAEGGVDVINIADGPRASVRMANWALGGLVRRELDMEVILHVCGRDRNLLGILSDMLAYHVLGLNNLVIITGDPPKVGDYPHATAVFDLDSVGILRLAQNFNRGIDPSGKPVGEATRFFCACGAEPAARDYERELRRLELKKAAGAQFVMTQPVYDPALLERFLADIAHLELPVLVGLLPLASHRNAEFLHNEVPGMQVPADVRRRMELAGSGPQARQEGVRIAQETLMAVQDEVVGAYIMPPLGLYPAALEVLSCIPGFTAPPAPGDLAP